ATQTVIRKLLRASRKATRRIASSSTGRRFVASRRAIDLRDRAFRKSPQAEEFERPRRGEVREDRQAFAEYDRMHQQVVLVDDALRDAAAREIGAAMRDDRLAILGFQLGDFLCQIAAGDSGLRPALAAGLLHC